MERHVIFTDIPGVETGPEADDSVKKLDAFLVQGCGCVRNCTELFSRDMIWQSVLDCAELDGYCSEHVNHQHLLLLGAMNALVHNQEKTIQKAHKPRDRVETRSTYMFRGVVICRKFFSVVFSCGEKRLKNVKKTVFG